MESMEDAPEGSGDPRLLEGEDGRCSSHRAELVGGTMEEDFKFVRIGLPDGRNTK